MNTSYKKHLTNIALLVSAITFSSSVYSNNSNSLDSLKQETTDSKPTSRVLDQEKYPWVNLYLQEPSILEHTTKALNITDQKAIDMMSESHEIKVSKDATKKIIKLITEHTYLKKYFTPQYVQGVIDNPNKGQGVFIQIYTSPNPEQDSTDDKGNFYSLKIYESYEQHNSTLTFVIFDLLTFKAYGYEYINGGYTPLFISTELTNAVKKDILK